MPAAPSLPTLVVTGDLTADWHTALARRSDARGNASWTPEDAVSVYGCPGGAALLADLLRALCSGRTTSSGDRLRVASPPFPTKGLAPRTPGLSHSFATWGLFITEGHQPAWRVRDFLGLDRLSASGDPNPVWKRVKADDPRPAILVLDDANLGFREAEALWPAALGKGGRPEHVVLKMADPTAQNPLWDRLIERFADRLTVIVPVNDLRPASVTISYGLSWELAATDLVRELATNPAISGLTAATNLIVSFGPEGALIRTSNKKDGTVRYQLIFDPANTEGEWARRLPGGMVGYTTCLAGAVIERAYLAGPQWLAGAIESGIAAMRALHVHGYGATAESTKAGEANLQFPTAVVVDALGHPCESLSQTAIPSWDAQRRGWADSWSILRDRIGGRVGAVAEEVVLKGPNAVLAKIPRAKFGKLVTVDRDEIAALRSLSAVLREYWDQKRSEPFSTAVFGPPGSGKSFAVKQLASSVFQGKVTTITFNLSQLAGPAALVGALHQVRDLVLGGGVPVVFWDEFDTSLAGEELGWLRYFLAPMQDGTFQDGQITHPIGRAIFVFAGGRATSVREFAELLKGNDAKAAKLPDFVSRLKGHLTVLGPNPAERGVDSFYPIRRALLIRALLERLAPGLKSDQADVFDIDRGVLRALLRIPSYLHGARSIESIIAMSQLAERTRFTRSSVPAAVQLGLHVDADEFLRLMQEPELAEAEVERWARAIHRSFVDAMTAKKYRYGPVTDNRKKTHSSLVAFDKLRPDEQEQNRDSARSIPAKLAKAGFAVVPRSASAGEPLTKATIERLAELEHERWVRMKMEQGWHYGSTTEKERHSHQAMLPWRIPRTSAEWAERYGPGAEDVMGRTALPETERDKDREIVREIPGLLKALGLVCVRR